MMSGKDSAKGSEPLREQPTQPNVLPDAAGSGFAQTHLNERIAKMDPVQREAHRRALALGATIENQLEIEGYPPMTVFDMGVTTGKEQMTQSLRERRLRLFQEKKAAMVADLATGRHSVVSKETGKVERIFSDPKKHAVYVQHLSRVRGDSPDQVEKDYQQFFNAFHDVETEDGHKKRLQALARGETVKILLPRGRRETIRITFPEGFTQEDKEQALETMWRNRELLVNAYDVAQAIHFQRPEFVDEYENVVWLTLHGREQEAIVRRDDLVERAATSPDFQNLLDAQLVIGRQSLIFRSGIAIPIREAKKIRGEALSGEAEIARIHENLSKLSETQLALVGNLVKTEAYQTIILQMLSERPLKIDGSSPLSGTVEGLTIFLGSTNLFARAKHTNRKIPIRPTIPATTGFDFTYAESLEDGKASVLTQWSHETHRRLLALVAHVDVDDVDYMTARSAKSFEHILNVIFKGCSSVAEQKERMEALGLTSGGVLSYPRATWLGMYFGYLEGTGDIAVITYEDLLKATQQWDKERKNTFPSAREILAERKDSTERGEHTV